MTWRRLYFDRKQMALCLQPIQNPFCVPVAGFLLWIHNLHRWQLYQPELVHHFILLMFVLKTLNHQQVFFGGWHRFCIKHIRGLNCDRASSVASWTLGALQRSKKLFARHWMCLAGFSLSVNASTGISWQSSSGLWLLMKHCSAASSTKQKTWQTLSWQMILRVLLLSGDIYPVPSWNRKCSQRSDMNCLSCWRDDQHPVARNDFG